MEDNGLVIIKNGVIKKVLQKVSDYKTHFIVDTSDENARRNNMGMLECRALRSGLHPNMPVTLIGTYTNENILDIQEIKPVWINNDITISYVMSRAKGSGVGRVWISRMVEKFGPDILVFDKELFRQKLVDNFNDLSTNKINKFLNVYFANASIENLENYLNEFGVNYEIVRKIDNDLGTEALKELEKDVYRFCIKYKIKLESADAIAKSLGIKALSNERIEGLICYYLNYRANSGHIYARPKEVAKFVDYKSMKSVYHAKIAPIYVANVCATSKRIKLDDKKGFVALRYLYNAEIVIASRLNAIDSSFDSNIIVTDADIDMIQEKYGIIYGREQRAAFKLLESHGINILTGGPGTGKTATICGIVELYKKFNPGKIVMFCAPTGRAAKRLSESVEYDAKTIHKLLEFQPFGTEPVARNATNPLECDFLIIDETSMVDVELLCMLLVAIKNGTRILFVGDIHQLPSVGAGNCLHDMIASNKFPVYKLTEVFRQDEDSSIVINSKRILNGELPVGNDTDFIVIKADTRESAFTILCNIMERYYDKNNPFKTQMIEPSKKDFDGTREMNKYVHSNIVFNENDGNKVSSTMQPGDKIIFTQNVYETVYSDDVLYYDDHGDPVFESRSVPLYVNGEMGIIKHLTSNDVIIDDGTGEEKILPRTSLSDAELSYSYTIHKSQGSENPIIIIYLPHDKKDMLTNALLYTAITRAKFIVIIVYTEDALESAVANFDDIVRDTRLTERILEIAA